ncbi:MAG: proline dehydrogenase [Austwickia sp.]|nr:proline dehydrogenase [Austwickia sp.]MBK8436638.1 proline dehydrogenase [Austwickia sp.]
MELRTTLRDTLLQVVGDPRTQRLVEGPRVSRKLVSRYIAGERLETAVEVAADLIDKGRLISAQQLLPPPADDAEAARWTDVLRDGIQGFARAGLTADATVDFDVSLSTLGLDLGPDGPARALDRARDLARTAGNAGTSITVSTDCPQHVDRILVIVRDLRQDFPSVGITVQAAFHRTVADCEDLAIPGSRVRLAMGSAGAGEGIHRHRAQVDRAYAACLRILMVGPGRPVVATDDLRLLRITHALAGHLQRSVSSFEYQLPYGVRPEMQAVIADRGESMRVHLPFGTQWYPYLVGRVAVAPTNLVSLARAVLAR